MGPEGEGVASESAAQPDSGLRSRHHRRQRRPSGAPPPLPRDLGATGRLWVTLLILVLGFLGVVAVTRIGAPTERFEVAVLRRLAEHRTTWLTDVARVVAWLGSSWALRLLLWGTIIALALVRRWRHLWVFVITILCLELVVEGLREAFSRPRPLGVVIIGPWQGASLPSPQVASLAVILVGMAYVLVPAGRRRYLTKRVAAVVVGAVGLAEVYLATAHPSDVAFGAILGGAAAVIGFRLFAPNEIFPVTYGRGRSAHLDLGGRRGEAIRGAVVDQLGIAAVEIIPFGLSGSGGSSPMRIRVTGEPHEYVFAKLYAKTHQRADRSYKLGRTILYGALEDEKSFTSVRRLIEYEDYCQRLMRDAGIRVAEPYGVVEITPEREYLFVTEFFEGAVEISEAQVDERVIDDGLLLIRKMWDAGLAHRDIKPANLLVKDGAIQVIDVAFAQVRPSPWRQAVDLGNMMLVLALGSDADTVYRHALNYFSEDELSEAFAATKGVASPSELRGKLKHDGRDLLEQFRKMAPPRAPISVQRWSFRRVMLTVGVALTALFGTMLAFSLLTNGVL